jgi:hypothetical protein
MNLEARNPMNTVLETPTNARPDAAHAPDQRPRRLDERRLAGIGAIGFASLVITTNIVQGALPAMDADASEVVTYLTDHRTENLFSTAAFAVGALFLLSFASAFYGRLKAVGRSEDLVWARLGMIGALLILPTFAAVVVQRIVLLVAVDEIIGSPELITLMWRFEMAAFLLNALPIAAGILGFGIAGARAGLLPRWFGVWAPIAAAVGVLSAACAVGSLEGAATGFAGFVPFATWMVLLLVAGVRQLRSAA